MDENELRRLRDRVAHLESINRLHDAQIQELRRAVLGDKSLALDGMRQVQRDVLTRVRELEAILPRLDGLPGRVTRLETVADRAKYSLVALAVGNGGTILAIVRQVVLAL